MVGAGRNTRSAAVLLVLALLLAACGGGSGQVDTFPTGGWPAPRADGRNSGTVELAGSRAMTFDWSRPLGGLVGAPVSVASNGQIFVSAQTNSGCNLFSFELASGRKRWCNRLAPGVTTVTPIVDSVANVYVGEDGAVDSYNDHGQLRWRAQVYGTPRSAQFLGDGSLLVVTHFGQVNILNTQNGKLVVPIFDLIQPANVLEVPNQPFNAPDVGLGECAVGAAACPVASSPAVHLPGRSFYLVLWRPGALAPQLVSMSYPQGSSGSVSEKWSSDLLPAAVSSSPVASADGRTVYVNDVTGRLSAFDAATGTVRWTYQLPFVTTGSPTVTADGLIIPSGGTGAHLIALQDKGNNAEVVWDRPDVAQLGVPALTAGNTGYTVAQGPSGLSLVTFDTQTGRTVDLDEMPDATGFSAGTAVGPQGHVIAATYLGELYTFAQQ